MERILVYKIKHIYLLFFLLTSYSVNVFSSPNEEYLFVVGIPKIISVLDDNIKESSNEYIAAFKNVEIQLQPIKIFDKYSLLDVEEVKLPNQFKFNTTVSHLDIFNDNREVYVIFKKIKTGELKFISWSFVTKVACFQTELIKKLELDDIFDKNKSGRSCDSVD